MALTHTISLVELLWTLFTGIGLYYNARIFIRAVGDLKAVKIAGNNSLREYSARLAAVTYLSWTVVQFTFFFVGLVALSLPIPGDSKHPVPLTYVISTSFVLISFLLAATSWFVERGRGRLIEMIEEQMESEGQ